jgi:hypothetical protein
MIKTLRELKKEIFEKMPDEAKSDFGDVIILSAIYDLAQQIQDEEIMNEVIEHNLKCAKKLSEKSYNEVENKDENLQN